MWSNPSAATWSTVVTSLQNGVQDRTPMVPVCWCSHPCAVPSHFELGLASMTNRIHQNWWHVTFEIRVPTTLSWWLVFLTRSSTLGAASCHMWAALRRGPCSQKLKPPAIMSKSENRSSSPIKPSNILTATSWETQSQNWPIKPFPDSWLSETGWNNKYLLL